MTTLTTSEALENVHDAASFIAFLHALRLDWESATFAEKTNPSAPYTAMHGWENTTIGTFLDAAAAGGADNRIGTLQDRKGAENPWYCAAEILYMGKVYE